MSLPYFRMFPTDYEADTAHLTTEEDGAYNRLLRLCWRTPGCSLPDDMEWIRRRVRATQDEFERAYVPVLREFFKKEKQRVFSPRLVEEWEQSNTRRNIAIENGRKGGRPTKPLKNKEPEQSNGLADQNQTVSQKKANQNQNHIPPYNPPKGEVEKLRDQMWNEWPQESRKRTSRSKFLEKLSLALKRDGMTCEEMLGAFRHWLSEQNREEGGKFVPNPERFFNAKFHLDHKGKTGPAAGNGQMSQTARDAIERKRRRQQAEQQEGSAQPEHLFLAAGGMR